jgi:hypothetical protein
VTPSSDSVYRTANLTLASFLAYNDKLYRLVRGEGKSATWEFDRSQVAGLVLTFEEGKAAVEPQSFHHAITKTRRTLFDFINGDSEAWTADHVAKHQLGASSR